MGWLKKFFQRKDVDSSKAMDASSYEIELSFQILIQSNGDIDKFFRIMNSKIKNEDLVSRLYNLIIIACGRELLLSGEHNPIIPTHYEVENKENVDFLTCPIYTKILERINTIDDDSPLILGISSCEVQAFNAMLHKLSAKQDDPLSEEQIEGIELYPPILPC